MKKSTLFFGSLMILSLLSYSFINKPVASDTRNTQKRLAVNKINEKTLLHDHVMEVTTLSNRLYDNLNLSNKGLTKDALDIALKGYLSLQEKGALKNSDLLTIVDFSQSSRRKRFYLLDIKNKELVENTYVAHGKNSGIDMPTDFSNSVGSEESSLGFYITKGTYTGKHGLSLRMSGLDTGYNDNAEARAIVVHGAEYVNSSRVQSSYMGRSQGCPAVPMENYKSIINKIKDGSALFIYYPDENYLSNSEVLNS